jgi:anti-anti-sigma factor
MSTIEVLLNIDGERVVPTLQEAIASLDGAHGEALLDFSSVCRLDSAGLRTLEELVRAADEKAVKIILRSVNVDVYKVLKLTKLTSRFSFVN